MNLFIRSLGVFTLMAGGAYATPPERIVSLGGAVTEIVAALGAQNHMVGRDSTSEYPETVKALPDVGYVRALSPEGIMALNPDLILAEGAAGPAQAVTVLQAAGIPYVALPDTHTADGVAEKIRLVGKALERDDAAEKLANAVTTQMADIAAKVEKLPEHKRVLFILALQSGRVMAGGQGSSAEAIIELAGGVNAATGFNGYKPLTDEAILTAAPDVILMMNREGDLAITNADVLGHAALATTPAAQSGDIIRMDGVKLLGFGPRTPEAVTELYDALYTPKSN